MLYKRCSNQWGEHQIVNFIRNRQFNWRSSNWNSSIEKEKNEFIYFHRIIRWNLFRSRVRLWKSRLRTDQPNISICAKTVRTNFIVDKNPKWVEKIFEGFFHISHKSDQYHQTLFNSFSGSVGTTTKVSQTTYVQAQTQIQSLISSCFGILPLIDASVLNSVCGQFGKYQKQLLHRFKVH